MKNINEQFSLAGVEELTPHPKNPRRGNLEAIRQSINANGWYGAILAQRSTGYILAGNHRFQAAVAEGAKNVPVLWVDVDDAQATSILLADNRSSDLADNDDHQLAALLKQVLEDTGDLAGTGYGQKELEQLLTSLGDPVVSDAEDQTGQLQDQYQILICCDSEPEQSALLERFAAEGLNCRALVS